MGFVGRKGRRKKKVSFNPSRDFIRDAVSEFLKKGGKITKVEVKGEDLENFVKLSGNDASVF